MGYAIYIRREPPLTLSEWKAAVDNTEGVRLDSHGVSATNPRTGDVFSIDGVDGDAQVKVAGEWLPCFLWRDSGAVAFRAPREFSDPACTVRIAAKRLATRLGAKLVGDGGEEYE
jgi:hypothetical protein